MARRCRRYRRTRRLTMFSATLQDFLPDKLEPEDEDTSIPIEEKINQIAYQRKLAENKLFGLNEEFAKQKLRERMS